MPESRPPPPSGTTITSASGACSSISSPIVPWPGDDRRIVERRHEHAALRIGERGGVALLERLAREHDLGAVVGRRDLLGERRVDRHVDARGDAERGRRERDALGVVAGARRDDAAGPLVVAQRGHAVGRTAQLEGARALQVLGLEQHVRARPARDRAGREHGRRRDHAVDDACARAGCRRGRPRAAIVASRLRPGHQGQHAGEVIGVVARSGMRPADEQRLHAGALGAGDVGLVGVADEEDLARRAAGGRDRRGVGRRGAASRRPDGRRSAPR